MLVDIAFGRAVAKVNYVVKGLIHRGFDTETGDKGPMIILDVAVKGNFTCAVDCPYCVCFYSGCL